MSENMGARAARTVALAMLAAVVCVSAAASQQSPLRKTDLVRLLTNPSLTKAQVAQRVRTACLAFDPTGRDRTDLQALGADATVMREIDNCVRAKAAAEERARAPAPPPAAPAPIRVATPQPRVRAPAGSQASLPVQVVRGGRAVRGISVTLRDATTRATSTVTTDGRGVASFRVQTGTAPGVRRFDVVAVGGETFSGAQLELVTEAGPPAAAMVQPSEISVRPGGAGEREIAVSLSDAYGNAVAGEGVELRPSADVLAGGGVSGETDSDGRVSFRLPTEEFQSSGEIGVFVRNTQLAALEVHFMPVVLSDAATRFVAGASQQAQAGEPLGEPLVLEVRDTTGAPVAGEAVAFSVANGEVEPASATTDSAGQVSVSLTAGSETGTTTLTATVGEVVKQLSLSVGPAPVQTLIVSQGTVPVPQSVNLNSSGPVVLTVIGRDAFGNEVPLDRVEAWTREPRVLRVARVETVNGRGRVELRGRRTGSAVFEVQAAGVRAARTAQVLVPIAAGQWVVAVRAGYTAFSYVYKPTWSGHAGPLAEILFGRNVWQGLTVGVATTFAAIKADDGSGTSSSVSLLDTSVRLEYSALPRGRISPVALVGGGQFQTRSGQFGDAIRHTNYFWLAGGGIDFEIQPRMRAQLRIITHRLTEITNPVNSEAVGSLIAVTAGARFGF